MSHNLAEMSMRPFRPSGDVVYPRPRRCSSRDLARDYVENL